MSRGNSQPVLLVSQEKYFARVTLASFQVDGNIDGVMCPVVINGVDIEDLCILGLDNLVP